MNHVERCYNAIAAAGFGRLDRETVIELVMASPSPAATDMVVSWLRAQKGDMEGAEDFLARAERQCRNANELAYVLRVRSMLPGLSKRPYRSKTKNSG